MHLFKFLALTGTLTGLVWAIPCPGGFANGDSASRAIAQTIPVSDGTTGSVVVPGSGTVPTLINGGAVRGSALFHSFSEFNVGAGTQVYFNPATGIDNILSRVTGSNISNILGTLGVNGSANLFLINPRGIIFGKDAELKITGGFVASTADRWLFEDGYAYQATNPNAPPLLIVEIKPGLQYGANASAIQRPGTITNSGRLSVGGGLQLAANQIEFQGGRVSAGNNIVLYAPTITLANQSLIQLSVPENATAKGDDLVIQTQNLLIKEGSIISTSTFSTQGAKSGDIDILPIDPTKPSTVTLNGYAPFKGLRPDGTSDGGFSSGIFVSSEEVPGGVDRTTGAGGILRLYDITNLNLENGAVISGRSFSKGAGGNVFINVTNLNITGGAQITVPSYKNGTPGNMVINAETINISGSDPTWNDRFRAVEKAYKDIGKTDLEAFEQAQFTIDPFTAFSGLQSSLLVGNGTSSRGAGAIIVNAGSSLSITDGGDISSSTYGKGDGGFISVSTGKSYPSLPEFATQVLATYDNQDVTTRLSLGSDKGRITISNRGSIRSSTFRGAQGNAGIINISTGRLELNNGALVESNVGVNSIGNAGEINIKSNNISLDNGSRIQSSLFENAKGDAGTITILSPTTTLNRSSAIQSNVESGAVGDAGGILIMGKTVSADQGSQIQTIVRGSSGNKPGGNGKAGAIVILADDFIKLTGKVGEFGSAILSSIGSGATGEESGFILLKTSLLYLNDGAYINTSNFSGKGTAGYILAATDFIVLDRASYIAAASLSGQGGDIGLESRYLVGTSRGSRISTESGIPGSVGNGGNVAISPEIILANKKLVFNPNYQTLLTYGFPYKNNDIVANAYGNGDGGNINISTLAIRNLAKRKDTPISDDLDATSNVGLNGNVNVNTFNLDVDRGLQPMTDRFRDYALSEGCDPRTRQEANSLKQIGTGTLAQDSTQQLERRTTIAVSPVSTPTRPQADNSVPIATKPNRLIPAQGWTQTTDGQLQFIAATSPYAGVTSGNLCSDSPRIGG